MENFWLLYSAKLNIRRDLTGGFRPQKCLYSVNGTSEAHERGRDNIFVLLHDTEVKQNLTTWFHFDKKMRDFSKIKFYHDWDRPL